MIQWKYPNCKRVMLMSFLKRIDKLHKENRSVYGIEMSNNDFSSFINVEPVDISLTQKFIIRKQEKAKLLLVSGKQRVYLSDNDIISTILDMEKNCIDCFLNSFIKLYNDEFEVFNFKLEDKLYKGIGISYYQSQREISLFSDTKIDINDFIFILNFIFSKDKQWENDTSQENFGKRTIIKYITLIDYYSNQSERSKNYLEKIGYPIYKPNFVIASKSIPASKIKNMFSDVNSFDISKYL